MRVRDLNDKGRAMNPKAKRSILGLISSLLLIAGFANAAERLDPVSSFAKPRDGSDSALRASDDCGYTCNFAEDLKDFKE